MKFYYLECEECEMSTQVTVPSNSYDDEPQYCPLCGYVCEVSLIDGEEDSDML